VMMHVERYALHALLHVHIPVCNNFHDQALETASLNSVLQAVPNS
jgi:hypothetical protein